MRYSRRILAAISCRALFLDASAVMQGRRGRQRPPFVDRFDEGGGERLSRGYAYNSFGDLTALTEGTDSYAFTYDGLGRLTSAYNRSYSYDGASRLTAFNGQAYGYGDSGPYHAVDRIAGADRFDYDANGNMVKRNKGLSDQQTLVWDAENRLSQVQDNNGDLVEQYWYGVEGMRVKKTRGNTTTYTFFAQYEEEVTNGVTTVVSYYTFGSMRVAVKRGNTLYHLHGDHLGSTSLTTRGSSTTASRAYYAYGAERSATGDLRTDHTFTGQKRDATGLMYYNARYYDPALGTFISADPMVPNPRSVIDHNRFLYARGNPLRFSDPTGYIPSDLLDSPKGTPPGADPWVVDFYWKNRWYKARGWGYSNGHWSRPIRPIYEDVEILHEVIEEDLVGWLIHEMKGNIKDPRLLKIAELNAFAKQMSEIYMPSPSFFFAKGEAYVRWALLVGPGREWDYKGHIGDAVGLGNYYAGKYYFYDVWANINYGYAGRAAGFTRDELLEGAGYGQAASDLIKYQTRNYDSTSNYDDPADQAAVRIGMALYDEPGLNIDKTLFKVAFLREASNLTLYAGFRIPGDSRVK